MFRQIIDWLVQYAAAIKLIEAVGGLLIFLGIIAWGGLQLIRKLKKSSDEELN